MLCRKIHKTAKPRSKKKEAGINFIKASGSEKCLKLTVFLVDSRGCLWLQVWLCRSLWENDPTSHSIFMTLVNSDLLSVWSQSLVTEYAWGLDNHVIGKSLRVLSQGFKVRSNSDILPSSTLSSEYGHQKLKCRCPKHQTRGSKTSRHTNKWNHSGPIHNFIQSMMANPKLKNILL